MNFLKELNNVQKIATSHPGGPLMVIAGPGSGKTRVLTYRTAYLLESGVLPHNILALTFTNKAAKEMKERIRKVTGEKAYGVWAGTFHSIFARILRAEASLINFPSNFTIYDTDDSRSLIREIIKTMGLDKKVYSPNQIRHLISMAKSNLVTPKKYADDPDLITRDRQSRIPHTYKIYERYVEKCHEAGAMDFDDLLLKMFELLHKDPENVLEKYRQRFQYVLVDEFQDTNQLQYAIIKKLTKYQGSPENLTIVGDDAQSIYAFRGATIRNILNFKKDFSDAQIFKLEQNYRSTHHIVSAANELITFNKEQIPKKIWADKGHGHKIRLIKAISDSDEGRTVADSILEQKNRYHLHNSDIAILYRTNAQSRIFEEHLRRHNLPYRIYGGLSFYQRKEVKDMLAYLRLAVNPHDNEAFKRVVNYPKRAIGKATMEKVITTANSKKISLWKAAPMTQLSARASKALEKFRDIIRNVHEKSETNDAYDSALFAYSISGLKKELNRDNSIEGMSRIENIEALFDGIKEFTEQDELYNEEAEQDKSISSYLQNIALLTDMDETSDNADHISLMSTHAAKGLEFKSVFVVGMEENLMPNYNSLQDPFQINEERRLFYVAVTRAEEYLTLSFAGSRYTHGSLRYNPPSRFLSEIPVDNFENPQVLKGRQTQTHHIASIKGFRKRAPRKAISSVDMSNFEPSPPHLIKEGSEILHAKFGQGEVIQIEGSNDNPVATIHFKEIDNPKRRIMLRFAKLQVLK